MDDPFSVINAIHIYEALGPSQVAWLAMAYLFSVVGAATGFEGLVEMG